MPSDVTTESQVLSVLKSLADPESGRSVVDEGQVRDIKVAGDRLSLTLALSTHSAPLWNETRDECARLLKENIPGLATVEVKLAVCERPAQPMGQMGVKVKSVIVVGSGKGGVGKSTVAASLAYGLKRAGARVGLMDADVYGPSIPHLLGLQGTAIAQGPNKIEAVDFDGLKVMSIGFFVPPGKAVAWRGPMLHKLMSQFLADTEWGELDYLIIDMPPGTGDVAISLSQLLPLTGAVVVCTPQDVALIDAVKAIAMFGLVHIPVLGMVENMSYFLCPDNGKRYDIFGSGGAKKCALEMDIPFLGEVPINIQVRINGDEGRLAGNYSDAQAAPYFETICRNLVRNLAAHRQEEAPLPSL